MGRRKKGDPVHGWVCLDKPLGLGSTPAVGRVRWLFQAQKAGHAGTLDPLASGILPIALGEATKTVSFMTEADKAYRFTIAWGTSTNTLDGEGEITATSDVRPTPAQVDAALDRFLGEVSQVPPAFSAIKVDGERAYALARAGEVVELAARNVTIHAITILDAPDADHLTLEMFCGKGTYVRSLARDIAAALGAEGHVSYLRRTRVGPFTETNAITLENLEDLVHRGARQEALLPVETALDDIPVLAVTDEDAFRLSQGRGVVLLPKQVETMKAQLISADATVLASHKGRAAAICEMRAGQIRPIRVFNL
jgi:tRNA pseudouridine55 synthase